MREIKGALHEQRILQMWKDGRLGGIKDDETAWCAGAANAWLERAGFVSARTDGAKNYLNWGSKLERPVPGCITVIQRPGGYHVFFTIARDAGGDYVGIGGNQKDGVSIATFERGRVLGNRWPTGYALPQDLTLPLMSAAIGRSTSEA